MCQPMAHKVKVRGRRRLSHETWQSSRIFAVVSAFRPQYNLLSGALPDVGIDCPSCLVVERPSQVREKITAPISYAKTPLQLQECRLTVLDELVGGDIANGDTGHFGGCEGGCRR